MKAKIGDLRRITQVAGCFLANAYVSVWFRDKIYKGPLKGTCLPFIYCHACPSAIFSCPMGTFQHYAVVHQVPFFLLGHLMVIGLLVGRMACGWLCPFGLVQDLVHVKSRTIHVPDHVARALRIIPYLTLGLLVIAIPYYTSEHWFSKLCPLGTMVAGIPWVLWNPIDPETGEQLLASKPPGLLFAIKIILLSGFVLLFVWVKRPFCRFVCPMGLIWSFFNKISVLQLAVDTANCDRCDTCHKTCPVDIKVYEDPNSTSCIRCLKCTQCAHVKIVTPMLAFDKSCRSAERLPKEGSEIA